MGRVAAAVVVVLVAGSCAKPTDQTPHRTQLPRIDIASRSAGMRAEYTARINAVDSNRSSVAALGKLAVFLHANDHLAAAATLYEELSQKDRSEARWPYLLARIVQDDGQMDRARALLEEAARRAPDYPLISLRRAELLQKSNDPLAAEAAYRDHLTQAPASAHARLGLARLAIRSREWKRAEGLLLEALQHEPNFQSARALLVSVFEALGEQRKAEQMRRAAGEARRFREPDDPWLEELVEHCFDVEKLSVLADIALEAERPSRALHLLERSRTIEPARARTHLEIGKAKLEADDRAAAVVAFAEAIRLDGTLAEAHYALVGELHRSGKSGAALAASDAALLHNSRNAGLHRQRGMLLQDAKRLGDAETMFRRAVSLDPGDVKNAEALGNFYWLTKQTGPAVEQFERARALSRLAVKPRALLGGFYLEAGRMLEAERCIAEAYEIDPDTEGLGELRALLYVRQGNARFRAGDPATAEAAYRLALEARPNHEEAVTNLVAVMQRTARGNEAGAFLSQLITQYPHATFAYSLAARVAAQNGNRAAALELAARALTLAREQKDLQQEQTIRALLQRLHAP